MRIVDAAERLLRDGRADFTMRDLASEAGVSFATPFNHFKSKAAIMQAISGRRIDLMIARYTAAQLPRDASKRVGIAIDTAVDVMLEEPEVNRVVMASIGTPPPEPSQVMAHSTGLWERALVTEQGEGADGEVTAPLARQLAIGFRGALSFWTARELSDDGLRSAAREMGEALLRGAQPPP
ncbi:TetR/AcrR family transcriptional regulator [Alteriqipengyuania sp. 357]